MEMISTIRVRALIWVGDMQFNRRTGWGIGMRSIVLDSRPR